MIKVIKWESSLFNNFNHKSLNNKFNNKYVNNKLITTWKRFCQRLTQIKSIKIIKNETIVDRILVFEEDTLMSLRNNISKMTNRNNITLIGFDSSTWSIDCGISYYAMASYANNKRKLELTNGNDSLNKIIINDNSLFETIEVILIK